MGYTITIERKALEDESIPKDLRDALRVIERYGLKAKSTEKQRKAAEYATKVRQERAIRKINDAVNLLRMEGRKVTAYAVAKEAGVSYNTVRKYLSVD